jgi:hypothetical protein
LEVDVNPELAEMSDMFIAKQTNPEKANTKQSIVRKSC